LIIKGFFNFTFIL